jgi:hypothetical protein
MTAMRPGLTVLGAVCVKTEIGYEARCPQHGGRQGRSRPRGSARVFVYNVLPCGVRVSRGTPPVSGAPRYRAPGSLTGDCPNARERAERQRIT